MASIASLRHATVPSSLAQANEEGFDGRDARLHMTATCAGPFASTNPAAAAAAVAAARDAVADAAISGHDPAIIPLEAVAAAAAAVAEVEHATAAAARGQASPRRSGGRSRAGSMDQERYVPPPRASYARPGFSLRDAITHLPGASATARSPLLLAQRRASGEAPHGHPHPPLVPAYPPRWSPGMYHVPAARAGVEAAYRLPPPLDLPPPAASARAADAAAAASAAVEAAVRSSMVAAASARPDAASADATVPRATEPLVIRRPIVTREAAGGDADIASSPLGAQSPLAQASPASGGARVPTGSADEFEHETARLDASPRLPPSVQKPKATTGIAVVSPDPAASDIAELPSPRRRAVQQHQQQQQLRSAAATPYLTAAQSAEAYYMQQQAQQQARYAMTAAAASVSPAFSPAAAWSTTGVPDAGLHHRVPAALQRQQGHAEARVDMETALQLASRLAAGGGMERAATAQLHGDASGTAAGGQTWASTAASAPAYAYASHPGSRGRAYSGESVPGMEYPCSSRALPDLRISGPAYVAQLLQSQRSALLAQLRGMVQAQAQEDGSARLQA